MKTCIWKQAHAGTICLVYLVLSPARQLTFNSVAASEKLFLVSFRFSQPTRK